MKYTDKIIKEYQEIETKLSLLEDEIEKYADRKQYNLHDKAVKRYNQYIDKLNELQKEYSNLMRLNL